VGKTTSVAEYNVPWGAPMTSEAGFNTREPDIKAWFSADGGNGMINAINVIQGYWGSSMAQAWTENGYYLILEPIYEYSMWYKYNISVTFNDQTLAEDDYISNRGAPTIVGTAKGCASLSNNFLSSLQTVTDYTQYGGENSYAEVKITYGTSFTASGMSSGYARAFPRMEYLTRQIGSLRAGSAGTSYLSVDAITGNTGWGMIALSASGGGDDIIDPPIPPEIEEESSYDGTIFTLTSTGGSTSSDGQSFAGGGVGTTTNFGNGYSESVCALGSFYAENCATGDEPYNLANSLEGGMSFEGTVPQVVFSGTSYDVWVDNSMGIIAGMMTVDPNTFPNVIVSSTDASAYSSYLSSVKNSLNPSLSMMYKDTTEAGVYSGSTLGVSQVIGGNAGTLEKELTRTCTLTQGNCTATGSDISWGVSGDYDVLASFFAIVFYNNSNAGADSGKTILENTDLMRAFWSSSNTYVAGLKSDGKLKEYWDARLAEKKYAEGVSAGNWAVQQWLLDEDNAEPEEPTEPEIPEGTSNRRRQQILEAFEDAHDDWEEAHTAWEEAKQAVYDAGYTSGSDSVNPAEFTCTYVTENKWKFILHYCSPIMQRMYDLHDKIPLNDGPSRGTKLWDDAWKVSFRLNVANTASFGNNVMSRLLVYMPIAGAYNTTVGGSVDVSYYVRNAHVSNTDFLLPDATSMDMR